MYAYRHSGRAYRSWVSRTLASAFVALAVIAALPAPAQAATASGLLAGLPVRAEVTSGYDRTLFQHWIDADGDGCDTRSEVLQAESTIAVTYSGGCTVATGRWVSPYDGAVWTQASDVDIDHLVPLAEAWSSGANAWTSAKRRDFANDLAVASALIAVTDNVNQSKSDQDPGTWLPPLASYRCFYAQQWIVVKNRYGLAVDAAEKSALQAVISSGGCGDRSI